MLNSIIKIKKLLTQKIKGRISVYIVKDTLYIEIFNRREDKYMIQFPNIEKRLCYFSSEIDIANKCIDLYEHEILKKYFRGI